MKLLKTVSVLHLGLVALASTLLERVDGFNTHVTSTRGGAKRGLVSSHALLASASHDALQQPATLSRRDFVATTAATAATAGLWVPNKHPAAAAVQGTPPRPIQLPPLGLGAWAWGDSFFWGYNPKNDDELQRVFDYAVANSKTSSILFDTAELYGFGRSESLLGEFSNKYYSTNTDGVAAITTNKKEIQIATKFAAFPTRTKPENVLKACEASLKRLGGDRPIDLYQIHFPNAWANEEYWDGLAQAYEKGLVKAVGVSNYGVDATRACHAALAKRGIPLSTNQIQLSLLYTHPLQNGLMDTCKELGVQVLSYSPLGLGMLTGKYTNKDPPQGPRKKLYEKLQETPDYDNLLAVMDQVAAQHGSPANKAQVAINWARAKGSIPIPGARTVRQVQQNYDALDWTLTKDEERRLDEAAAKVKTFVQPSESPFPKKDINTGLVMFDS
jgi:pyridoxine 4-dehydrogenase